MRFAAVIIAVFTALTLSSCSEKAIQDTATTPSAATASVSTNEPQVSQGSSEQTAVTETAENTETTVEEDSMKNSSVFYVTADDVTFPAEFASGSGADALRELLAGGDLTISMEDYGGFEKVGHLGQELPTDNSQTSTEPGDIVLYQGNQIVMFYGNNSWSYTRLGRITELGGWEEALGDGAISATFSLRDPRA